MSVASKTKRRVRLATVITAASLGAYLFATACSSTRPEATSGSQTTPGSVLSGPCTVEGTTSACHIETGRSGDIVNCFSGTQVCHEGVWSACGGAAGGGGTLSTMDLSKLETASLLQSSAGVHPLTISSGAPSAEAGGCASNPCNPNCVGIDTDAGNLAPDGGIISIAVQGSLVDYSSFPAAKQGAANLTANWCPNSVPAPTSGGSAYRECNYDYCCGTPDGGGATGTCQKWLDSPEAGVCTPPAAKVDYTLGVGCQDAAGNAHLPLCNRGTVDATSGSLIMIDWTANPNTTGTAAICQVPTSGAYKGKCTINLATAPIKAGKCIDINLNSPATGITCDTGLFGSGNHTAMVNPPSSASAYGTAYTQITEADACNNQSFVITPAQGGICVAYGAQPPPPAVYTFTQSATCLPGYKVQWNQFAWQGLAPNASQIDISIATAPLLADGGVGTFGTPIAIAKAQNPGGPDYATCRIDGTFVSVTGTTGTDTTKCPKNLTTLLGAQSTNPTVQVGVTLTSTTATASLQGWQITYNCIAAE